MTTTLNLPTDLARAVERRAALVGRDIAAEVVELVRKGLDVSEPLQSEATPIAPVISKDPQTGLPTICGAPNAPISRMTTDEILALYEEAQLEEDLERLGAAPRR